MQPSRDVLIKGVLKICCKFTEENPCRSVISVKLLCNFFEITLRYGRSLVNLLRIFRSPLPKNNSTGLLLLLHNAIDNLSKYHCLTLLPNLECSYFELTNRIIFDLTEVLRIYRTPQVSKQGNTYSSQQKDW